MIGLKEISIRKNIERKEKERIELFKQYIVNEFCNFVLVENIEEIKEYMEIKLIQMYGEFEYDNLITLSCNNFKIGHITFNEKEGIIQVSSHKASKFFKISLYSNKPTRYKQYKNIFRYILRNSN